MSANICLAVNYLVLNESTRQMWTSLARHLEEFEIRLVLLTTAEVQPALPFPTILVPFLMRDYAAQFPTACRDGGSYSARDWELAQADCSRAQNVYSPAEAIIGVLACRNVMKSFLDALQPTYVLTWDSTSPLAMVLRSLCHDASVPVQSLERGLLPETLMIESFGMQGHSDLRTNWLAQEMPAANAESWERVRAFYLNRKPQKYSQPDFTSAAQLRDEWKLGAKKTVVLLGHFDPCGLTPPDSNQRRYFSPAFRNTEDLLTELCALLRKSTDNAFIFKPHPLDKNPYEAAKASGVRVVTDLNVHSLIELADVVVAQFTTLQFEAALYDKPVVLAGRSAWWGRNATYEVARREDLGVMLAAALQREDWESRSANARAFLAWIMDHWLIGCGAGVPARRNLSDLAKFISANILNFSGAMSVEQRFVFAEIELNQWRDNGMTASTASAPETVESLRARAQLLCRLGSWEQAAEIYRTLTNRLPDELELWQARLDCVLKAGQRFVAGLLRGDALRTHPEWANALPEVPSRKPAAVVPAAVLS